MKTAILLLISLPFFANCLLAQNGLSIQPLQVDFTVIKPINSELNSVNRTYPLREISGVSLNDSLLPYLEIRSVLISKDLDAIKTKFGEPVYSEITPRSEKQIYKKGLKKVEVEIDRAHQKEMSINYYQKSNKKSEATVDQIREIEIDKTSNAEIIEVFGTPTMVRLSNDKETWVYNLNNGMLRIYFHLESGLVQDFKFQSNH